MNIIDLQAYLRENIHLQEIQPGDLLMLPTIRVTSGLGGFFLEEFIRREGGYALPLFPHDQRGVANQPGSQTHYRKVFAGKPQRAARVREDP